MDDDCDNLYCVLKNNNLWTVIVCIFIILKLVVFLLKKFKSKIISIIISRLKICRYRKLHMNLPTSCEYVY